MNLQPDRGHGGHQRHQSGFTLIELMIVVAIVGILSAVAYPSYTESVRRGDRSAARAALLEAQQFMERYYAANSRYSTAADGTGSPTLPPRLQAVPEGSPKYDLTVSAVTLNSYTLTADPRAADKCENLTLTNTGVKGRSATVPTIPECWK
ncbi:MAG: type IV pilin protein [Gammaproteobacteria bacterium]|uniref:type IV pilin protein n=1 Tax=Rhodoferax sp. TaxID=50421 RepID=UPI0017FDFE80|nr:type IV pilin protein [Rhodoferax sp.]MBU3899151.1 type IV pilin protein [Gammaproteobacteria bacterium]MBA3058929.1 type IV pilin protein [Rhodoferax sp.]MBU3997453.1 type IV pilin protein [Gammaproteobacteria bacterium]MBU4018596.1 type IV pilin protein [Gammaproteobacteria bacterium]MBU4080608.1 type IV pilin protein [Gammaproteobacteria bacterium]